MSEDLVLTADCMPAEADVESAKRVLEAVLLASQEPLASSELRRIFDNELSAETLRKLLDELRQDWQGRGVELVQVATGWRFQTRLEYQKFIERLRPERPVRYSRAVMETLAIIAYRQPVTRGDIEEIRGVGVSSQILKTLEARGWIDVVGHKEVPGRPALFATTKALLDDLGLRSLQELPPLTQLEELEARAAGVEVISEGIEVIPEGVALLPEGIALRPEGVQSRPEGIEAAPEAELISEGVESKVQDEVTSEQASSEDADTASDSAATAGAGAHTSAGAEPSAATPIESDHSTTEPTH
jgi:segregation and condensation protein B